MDKPRIGINGFGRIGRNAARVILATNKAELVAINSGSDAASHAYLLSHDSVYGKLNKPARAKDGKLFIDDTEIAVFMEKEPTAIPWDTANVDIVLECTGKFRTKEGAAGHQAHGVKAVVMSAPAKDDTPTFVMGVNQLTYDAKTHGTVVSNSSCTTNCVTTVLKVLDDAFGVSRGNMTTIHAATDSQNLLDNSHKKEVRLRRSSLVNLIPASSGSAKDVAKFFPHLKDKLPCRAIRVPTPTVSMIDLVVEVNKPTDAQMINDAFRVAADKTMNTVLSLASEELVSTDYIGSPFSATVDPFLTDVVIGTLVHVVAWYDNEWGYANRLVDLAVLAATSL